MITATLIGGTSPQKVQIVISATPAGADWVLTGQSGGYVWEVPGGVGVGDGNQLTLADNRGPGNSPITYVLKWDGGSQTSTPVTVPFESAAVVQSLDGHLSAHIDPLGSELPWTQDSGQALFTVPGRRRPVVRYSTSSDISGVLAFMLPVEQTPTIDAMLAEGGPLLLRLGQSMDDMPPVSVFAYRSPTSRAIAGLGKRRWEFPYTLVDDPFMDQRLGAFTWDYTDALQVQGSMIIRDAVAMEAALAGLTGDQTDAFDWSVLA